MKTKISAVIVALSAVAGCRSLSDTYDFTNGEEGMLNMVHWSFEPGSEVYAKTITGKTYFKAGTGTAKTEYDITLYNRTEVSVYQMTAEFSQGSLSLNGIQLTTGSVFDVNGQKELTFKFVPASDLRKATLPVTFYSYTEDPGRQVSVYTIELVENIGPTAVLAVTPSTAAGHSNLNYILDATGSVDGDADAGGTLDSFTYTITKIGGSGGKQSFSLRALQGNQIVYTFPYTFPDPGEFTVKLTVTDSNGATSAEVSKSVTVM